MMKRIAGVLLNSTLAYHSQPSTFKLTNSVVFGAVLPSPSTSHLKCLSTEFLAGNFPQNVGFIGLGNMGSHMAINLLKAGYSLCVLDRNEDAMQALVAKGASAAKTPLEVAEESDVVITMLPASSHVLEVYTGHDGLLTKFGPMRPSLFVDCSTIDPQTCRLLAAKVDSCTLSKKLSNFSVDKAIMLDAPVSGGVGGAKAGTLTFMVGGPSEGLNAIFPLLNAMGKRVVHCGGTGNGAVAKLCNNLVMGISMAAVSEGYALGQRMGIDAMTLSKIFNSSSARCWSSDTYNPVPGVMGDVPASQDYCGGFSCQLLTKDLGLAVTAAKEIDMAIPLTEQVHEMYFNLCQEGHSHEDFSGIFQFKYKGQSQPSSDPLLE